MELQQPNRFTLVEQVTAQIESLIENGVWPVGERIPPEPELVDKLGVSRNTVREAIRALIHGGMLRTRQGDGTYVCSSSSLSPVLLRRLQRSKLSETLEVRAALEQEAARLASLRRTTDDVIALQASLDARRVAEESGDVEAFVAADVHFHKQVIAAAHNSILSDLYNSMTEAVRNSVSMVNEHMCVAIVHSQMSETMIEAIINQDEAAAAEAVRTYIQASQDALLQASQGGNKE
ncbi:FadR/GntR family transcriptional regulator [Paenibacillus pini]|uniref:Transcriptional regulator n=1 Tax=Paenibacillus pini JCM 16418 TaxID=1236976 RepID=W7YRD1_9BACL|nr:FadR/GntR family transcriptional regulator [Paenibacillus pini]GAF10003.1 transcriptional regulator [Paenibacillus pini JCM 16418]